MYKYIAVHKNDNNKKRLQYRDNTRNRDTLFCNGIVVTHFVIVTTLESDVTEDCWLLPYVMRCWHRYVLCKWWTYQILFHHSWPSTPKCTSDSKIWGPRGRGRAPCHNEGRQRRLSCAQTTQTMRQMVTEVFQCRCVQKKVFSCYFAYMRLQIIWLFPPSPHFSVSMVLDVTEHTFSDLNPSADTVIFHNDQ